MWSGCHSHLVSELMSGQSTVEPPLRGGYRHTESPLVPKGAWEALLALGWGCDLHIPLGWDLKDTAVLGLPGATLREAWTTGSEEPNDLP